MWPEGARRAFVTALLLAATAWASDDDALPLYELRDGKRLPTVVIPRAGPSQTGLLIVEYSRHEQPADEEDSEALEPLTRRHEIAYYAGYPVSVCRGGLWEWGYSSLYRPDYERAIRETYRARRYVENRERGRRFNVQDMRQRRQRLLSNHEAALRSGLEYLRAGNYSQAVVAFTMAAELNHADPACRIHLAQARLALAQYEDAAAALRRALQLQPRLAFLTLDLGRYYPEPADLDRFVDALAAFLRRNPASANVYFLLGYLEFQRGNFEAAQAAFQVAQRGLPNDSLTRNYLSITKPPGR
jgi:tetratricopeptide (TPR) repeat protein